MKHWNVVLLVVLFLVLAGCDSTGGATTNPDTQQPTSLHITRPATNGYPSLTRTIQNQASVQQLYQAALVLPKPSTGVLQCSDDLGVIYQLDFVQGTTSLQNMTLQASGCEFIYLGPGLQNARLTNNTFQSLFLKTVGEPSLLPASSHT